jgi:hypothetical protein
MSWRGLADRIVVPALLALLCAAALWRVLAVMGLHVPLDPNEGWNAYHAASAMGAGALYPGPQSFMVNNYPPLSFYLVGALSQLLGDNVVAGRIVSLLAFDAVGLGLYAVGRRMGCSRSVSSFPPLFFAAGLLVFTDYVGMNDPQLLAHAIAMGGFLIALREPRRMQEMALAALLFVIAAFVKHNVVAMAIATTVWLFFEDRRRGLHLAALGLGFLVIGLALFHLVYGRSLLSVAETARLYSFDQLRASAALWLHWTAVPIAVLAVLAVQRWREPYVRLCVCYTLVATAIGVGFLGGAGVDQNVLFDADIALALTAALALDRLSGMRALLVAATYAAPLFYTAATSEQWRDPDSWIHPLRDEAEIARQDIALIASRPGPALCEMQSFCYWAGKPAAVDVFNVGQQFDTGARSDALLTRQIEARRFAVIQFDPDSPYSLGQNVHDAMARSYRLHHSDDYGAFYIPN